MIGTNSSHISFERFLFFGALYITDMLSFFLIYVHIVIYNE